MTKEVEMQMSENSVQAVDDALKEARRATGNASSTARPDPEESATARRRQFSGSERHRILVAADACKEPGDIGALLRREGIYSSHLATWRKQRTEAERTALTPKKRGRKPDIDLAEARHLDQLTRENDRLRHQLAQARTIIDVQKKVYTLLEQLKDDTLDGKF